MRMFVLGEWEEALMKSKNKILEGSLDPMDEEWAEKKLGSNLKDINLEFQIFNLALKLPKNEDPNDQRCKKIHSWHDDTVRVVQETGAHTQL